REVGPFLEVYVRAPLDVLVERDVKGLYRQALAGKIQGFTGGTDPYEEPEHPDLICDTHRESVAESARKVIRLLEERGYIPRFAAGGSGGAPVPFAGGQPSARDPRDAEGGGTPRGDVDPEGAGLSPVLDGRLRLSAPVAGAGDPATTSETAATRE